MKKFFILLFAIIIGCSVYGDNEPKAVKVSWIPNPEEQNVIHYEIYWWQGDDTLSWSIPNMSYVGLVAHQVGADTLWHTGYIFSYDYIRAGAIAVNINSVKSGTGLSNFEYYHLLFGPSAPNVGRVEEE